MAASSSSSSSSSPSSSSANKMRREKSLARVAILSNYGDDGGSGGGGGDSSSNSDDARADSPFTMLDRALDEIEKKGRPSSVESVAAVVASRPDAPELTRLRERRRSTAAAQDEAAVRAQRHRQRAEDALCGGASGPAHRRGQSMSSHPSLLRPGGRGAGEGMVLHPKAKSEAAYDAERSRNRKQQQPQQQEQQQPQGQHPGYPSSRDNTSSWTRDATLRPADNALPAVPPIPRASEGPLARRPVSMAVSLPSVKAIAADTQRPQARDLRTSTARSDAGARDRHSTYSDGGGAVAQAQDQRRFPRGVPNNFQAYRASRASWAAPSVLEAHRARVRARGEENRVSRDDGVRRGRGEFEAVPAAAAAAAATAADIPGERRHRRPASVGREKPSQEPVSFEMRGDPRPSTCRASGVPDVGTRLPASTRPLPLDPREFAAEIRDHCTVFLESFAPEEPRATTGRVDPSGAAVPGAGASFTQRVASGQTGPTAGSGASRRRISAYNPLFAVEIPPLFNDRPAAGRCESQATELHCSPPAALEIRGHCSEARLRSQASDLRRAGLDFGFAAVEPVPAPIPASVPASAPVLAPVDSYDSLHLPKPKASGPPPSRRSFFAPWMPTPSGPAAAETVADPRHPSPLGSTLSFEPGEDRLDVRRPAPAGRPGDDRYRLPSQTARRAPADVVRRKPLPPAPQGAPGSNPPQQRIARVPVPAPMTDPAARRTLRRAGDVHVLHGRNGSA